MVARKNRKEKIFSFSFFPAKTFLIRQLVLQIHSYVLRACAVCYTEGRDIPTLSRMRFSTEQTPFIERYFFASKNSFSVMATGTRIIPFLHQFARPVLFCVKANCSLTSATVLTRTLLHVPPVVDRYPLCCTFVCC